MILVLIIQKILTNSHFEALGKMLRQTNIGIAFSDKFYARNTTSEPKKMFSDVFYPGYLN